MAKGQHIDLDYVVNYCEQEADKHKLLASYEAKTSFGSVKDARKRDEHMSKSQMADELASHFRKADSDVLRSSREVETLAREIDPESFASFDAMVVRLKAGGSDESYALQAAQATYGDQLAEAYAKASSSVAADTSSTNAADPYMEGITDAIMWHEARAVEADVLERREPIKERKVNYAKRAARHRLYAKHMRQELLEAREKAIGAKVAKEVSEPVLPFPTGLKPTGRTEEGIPLDVQMRFLKKTEVMDDEGW